MLASKHWWIGLMKMHLKKHTDYALRVLMLAGSKEENTLTSIKEIADTYSISIEHVRKVVFQLNKLGFIQTSRGRNGGLKLAQDPRDINIGKVVRLMEDDFVILECFNRETNQCILSPACKLKHALNKALLAFFQVLDAYTLADVIENQADLKSLMDFS